MKRINLLQWQVFIVALSAFSVAVALAFHVLVVHQNPDGAVQKSIPKSTQTWELRLKCRACEETATRTFHGEMIYRITQNGMTRCAIFGCSVPYLHYCNDHEPEAGMPLPK